VCWQCVFLSINIEYLYTRYISMCLKFTGVTRWAASECMSQYEGNGYSDRYLLIRQDKLIYSACSGDG